MSLETLRRGRERAEERAERQRAARESRTTKRPRNRLEKLKSSSLTQAEAMVLAEMLLPGGSKLAQFRLALVLRIGDPKTLAEEIVKNVPV